MREFLYSEIAVQYGLRNVPDRELLDVAIEAGTQLCSQLLEPIQQQFGRIHVRSGYRSFEVNAAGVNRHNCAADNRGFHTWDHASEHHGVGATACISVPRISRQVLLGLVPYESIAWWIHDHLPAWSHLEFFATPEHSDEVCFNIGWLEKPLKTMTTWRGGPRALHKCLPSVEDRVKLSQTLVNACGV
ncbi:peptidase M15 [Diaphorobacter caeni]|uniref:peptidase M15 n=1 Tax=Diaphorobacter caeni TaxID=2784387 RepID=UPI00188EBF66|nr:peptidase M15 [Diaphorobacter caeni]MBF5007447.1 peptidase M15 [Diaphorobacter caeni]